MTKIPQSSAVTRDVLYEFGSELADTILTAVQRMFDEQNLKNDEKFATTFKLQEVKNDLQEFKDEFRGCKRETTSTLAEIVGELRTIREEQITGSYRQIKHTDQLGDHEVRITAIEDTLELAS